MSEQQPQSPRPVTLRQKAEAHFREEEAASSENIDDLPPEALRTILHELRVHQIELGMQNEELRTAQGELDAARSHYFELYDLAPVGYITVSETGLILEANLTATALLGVGRPKLVKQPFSRFILKEDQDIFYLLKNEPRETFSPTCDLRMLKPDGTTFWAHLKIVSARDENGEPLCRIVLSDISWRKQAEEDVRSLNAELRANEERLHELNALGELLLLPDSIEKKFNHITDTVVRVFGADFARIWIIKPGDRCNTGCVHAQEAEGPHVCRFRDKCLHLLASSGRYTHTDGGAHARVPFGCYKIGKIATGEEAGFLTNEVSTDPRVHDHAWAMELGLRAFAGYCLTDSASTPVGVMALFSKQAISKHQDLLLRGFAHLAGLTLIAARSEEALRRNEIAVEQSGDGIAIADTEGTLVFLNTAWARLHGYEPAEMIGQPLSINHTPEQLEREVIPFNDAVREKGSHMGEQGHRRKDGTTFPAWMSVTDFKDANGKSGGILAIAHDITERKQTEAMLQEKEIQLAAILEAAADGILAVDSKGKVMRANRRFAEIWRIPEPVMKSGDDRTLLDFIMSQLSDPDAFLKKVQSLYDSDEESFDTIAFKDGRVAERYSFAMIMGGGRIGRVWSFRDVTARKRAEEEILRINRQLTEATEKAERATAAKSEFLGIMAHELRNPLNGVLGFAELLSDTSLDDEQKGYVRTISSSGEHLLAVVNDTLDLSSIEAGTLAIHAAPFDLADLVKSSSELVRKSATDKGVAFYCEVAADVPTQITGDERRLRQILINLLANAVKFTSDGSVSLRVTRSGEFLDFSVEDTGLGISSEALARLFQLFTQADSTINKKYGGTGIGLAVSKRLAEAMGGTVSVLSAPGKGSTFTFRLPLEARTGGMATVQSHLFLDADGASPSSPRAEAPARPDDRPLVLVVEDDRNSSVLADKLLQSLGYRVECACNGAEAVEAFSPGKYLAILMDLRMPEMNGFEAVGIIRSRESGSRVPIIALSANVMSGSRETFLAAGMDDFLPKPFKRAELAAKLACWHSQSHAPTHGEK